MDSQTVIDILNELLVAEQQGLAHRLRESTVYISELAVGDAGRVRKLATQSDEHAEWLTNLILESGGSPGPRRGDVRSADLHYQELRHVLPRLARDQAELIRKYALACERVAAEPRTATLVARILARHQAHLDALRRPGTESVSASN